MNTEKVARDVEEGSSDGNAVENESSNPVGTVPLPKPKGTTGYGTTEHDFDRGTKAWLQALGAFFLWFNSWGIINTFGVFQTYYEENILSHESASTIAWIGSLQAFLLMMGGAVSGPLFDAGYFYVLVPFGSLMVVFGFMMTSLCTEYYQIMLAQGACVGIGTGCLFVPAVALLPQYFHKKRALANGVAATGSSIGGVLYPIMFYRLQQEAGFGWATRALAFVALATCSVSIAVMRVRFSSKQKRALLQLSAFKEKQFTLFCLAMFIGFMGFYNFLSFVQPWAIQKRIVSPNLGFYLLPILNAASTFGRIGPNYAAGYVGPLNVLTPAAAITALLAFCWIAVDSTAGIIVLTLLYGFFSGGFVSLPPVVMSVITADLRSLGTRVGMLFAVVSLALLVDTPVGGAILSDTGSYLGLQLFCGACLAACAVVLLSIRIIRSGPKLMYHT